MAPSGNGKEGDNSGERGNNSYDDGDHRDKGDRDDNTEELATRSLRIQSKRYYVDVKQNQRGRFMKLVEGLPNGNKNRISFPMSNVPEVRDKLTAFGKFWEDMEENGGDKEIEASEDGRLKSDDIRSGQRRIYFDLKENKRGVFLRISSTASYGATRQTVALPAQGIMDIRNVMSEMVEKFGQDDNTEDQLPEFQEMRVERKRFYFDCGNNDRGSFLRISEVTNRYRSSITIPQQGLSKFKDILTTYYDSLAEKGGASCDEETIKLEA